MYTTIRLIHVIAGIFVGGTYLFIVPILEPRLKRLGPAIQSPVMSTLMPILAPVMGISFLVLFGTGTAMTLMLRQGNLVQLLTTTWGWIILVGISATLAICVIGFGIITPTGMRLEKLSRSIKGRAPKPEEEQQLHQLGARIETLSRINFVFVIIAVATMVIARYF